MTIILDNHEILFIGDRVAFEVDVTEWWQKIRLAAITALGAAEVNSKQNSFGKDGGRKMNSAAICGRPYQLVAACAVDEKGNRIFTDEEAGAKSVKVIQRLAEIAAELNGFNDAAIEDAEKN